MGYNWSDEYSTMMSAQCWLNCTFCDNVIHKYKYLSQNEFLRNTADVTQTNNTTSAIIGIESIFTSANVTWSIMIRRNVLPAAEELWLNKSYRDVSTISFTGIISVLSFPVFMFTWFNVISSFLQTSVQETDQWHYTRQYAICNFDFIMFKSHLAIFPVSQRSETSIYNHRPATIN